VNTPQVWTVIAIMAAGLASMITLVFQYMTARFDVLTVKMDAGFTTVDARFEALTARMDDRFTAFEARFDHLDRDVQRVIERVFP
jgi:hypothetical protein